MLLNTIFQYLVFVLSYANRLVDICNGNSATEPDRNFLGCYSLTACSFSDSRIDIHTTSPQRPGEGSGQDCINYCNEQAQNSGMYSFAALQNFRIYHVCYCFENLINNHQEMFKSACLDCSDDCESYFLVWQTCPIGYYDPVGGCSSVCPSYCLPNPDNTSVEIRCTNSGQCLDGCKDNFCQTIVPVEDVGTAASEYTEPHPAMFVMYTQKNITQHGYITKVSFFGRTKGLVYISIWTYIGMDDQRYSIYVMNGKIPVHSDVEGHHELLLSPREYIPVEPGNHIAVHLDAYLMNRADGNKEDFTVLYARTDESQDTAVYSNSTILQDDHWQAGKIILLNPVNKINADVSVSLTISGKCPSGCKNLVCGANSDGEIICTDGCKAGHSGIDCSLPCEDGKYGESCSLDCPGYCFENKCHSVCGLCIECQAGKKGDKCEEDCPTGLWGNSCKMSCGACYKGTRCDIVTGECKFGCEAGYYPPRCTDVCPWGTFGLNCSLGCSPHCRSSKTSCDPRTGACPAIGQSVHRCNDPNLANPLCSCPKDKVNYYYGPGCTEECGKCIGECDAMNGICKDQICSEPSKALPNCKCVKGSWGPNCEFHCGHCHESEACDAMDGFCPEGCDPGYQAPLCMETCQGGYWGEFCGHKCGQCVNDAPCSTINGSCPGNSCEYSNAQPPLCYVCTDGFYGTDCSLQCPGSCESGSCDKITGECASCNTSGEVLQLPDCKCPMGYYGKDCTSHCSKCSLGCKSSDGRCVGPCMPGFEGDRCNIPCVDSFWGAGCSQFCGWCRNGEICDKVTGACPSMCVEGYREPLCKCTIKQWMDDCSRPCGHCLNDDICDSSSGKCPNGCILGYYGDTCDLSCPPDKFGKDCQQICGKCAQGRCDPGTGLCLFGCEPGFMPPMCTKPCPAGMWGWSCSARCGECKTGQPCLPETGECYGGCKDYYQPPTCINQCIHTFGAECDLECPPCKGELQCNRETGQCPFGCSPGYDPPYCSATCDKGNYGEGCTKECSNCLDLDCSSADGRCLLGCNGTFEMPFCLDICYNGKWGDNCAYQCGHCSDCSETCDIEDGSCQSGCAPGYLAPDCVEHCKAGFYGKNCQQECGFCRDGTCNFKTGECVKGCKKDYLPPLCQVKFK